MEGVKALLFLKRKERRMSKLMVIEENVFEGYKCRGFSSMSDLSNNLDKVKGFSMLTFVLEYEHGVEEMDVYATNGHHQSVAEALAKDGYASGCKVIALDDY